MKRWAGVAVLALAAIAAGCGSDGASDSQRVIVGAAASLEEPMAAFELDYEQRHPDVDLRIQRAGSDAIAAQIRQGVEIDVFLSASFELAETLHGERLIERPVAIAGNSLVVIAPTDSPVDAIEDLDNPGVRLAIGQPNVPVGAYVRDALSLVGDAFAIRAMENVRTNELDVNGIVGKVSQGVVDAGVMYRTDAVRVDGPVKVIPFAREDQPEIRYAAALVSESASRDASGVFDELVGERVRTIFAERGFRSP